MFPIKLELTVSTPAELARIAAFVGEVGTPAARSETPKAADKPKADKPAATPAPTAAPAVQEAAQAAARAAAGADVLDYAVLQKAVFRLARKAPTKCDEACGKMGVKTMRDLPAEKRAEALAVVEKFIAEVGA